MKKALHKRIMAALDEEEDKGSDMGLLNMLRTLASEDSRYFQMEPERRNALNEWFEEAKDLFLQELLTGNYGVQILLDSFFVLCFEVGFRLHELEVLKKEGELS